MNKTRRLIALMASIAALSAASATFAQKKYDPGANDKEIVVGAIYPFSGPASGWGTVGKAAGAYFDKVNAEGGINGRKIRFVPLDDGFNPAKTVEVARKLVEQEQVLLVFNVFGTAGNSAIQKYLNAKKVPQLFIATLASKWGDPVNFPWTMAFQPNGKMESGIFASHILDTKPNAKVAVLYQNDDYGKDLLKGFTERLGDRAKTMIVAEVSYEITDATIDSQLIALKASGADTFINITSPKFAAMAIKKAGEIGWKPTQYLASGVSSVKSVLTPAGLENSVGLITGMFYKDPTDPQWANDTAMKEWVDFMKKYYPQGELTDSMNVAGPMYAQALVQVLKQCGDNLTRENVMKQAASLDMTLPLLLPGIVVKTAPDDYYPVEREQLAKFDGKSWVLFGKVYGR